MLIVDILIMLGYVVGNKGGVVGLVLFMVVISVMFLDDSFVMVFVNNGLLGLVRFMLIIGICWFVS